MHSETPKSRFGISPGMSARSAEEERRSEDVRPQMRIQGGTAARLAESELRGAAQRPLSIRLQARAGGAFLPDSLRGADAANARWHEGKESMPTEVAASAQEDKTSESVIREHSRQPSAADRLPSQAMNFVRLKKDFSLAKNEKKNSTTRTSPLQKLRALFLRKLPKTGTPDQEQSG